MKTSNVSVFFVQVSWTRGATGLIKENKRSNTETLIHVSVKGIITHGKNKIQSSLVLCLEGSTLNRMIAKEMFCQICTACFLFFSK